MKSQASKIINAIHFPLHTSCNWRLELVALSWLIQHLFLSIQNTDTCILWIGYHDGLMKHSVPINNKTNLVCPRWKWHIPRGQPLHMESWIQGSEDLWILLIVLQENADLTILGKPISQYPRVTLRCLFPIITEQSKYSIQKYISRSSF